MLQLDGLDEMRKALGVYERARSAYSKMEISPRELDTARAAYERAVAVYERANPARILRDCEE